MSNRVQTGPWGAVPCALMNEPGITLNRMRVYAALASYQGNEEQCWPSLEAIAERSGVPRGAISECTAWLEERGWIRKHRRSNERKNTLYVVLRDVVEPEVRETRKSGTPGDRAKSGTPGLSSIKENNKGKEQPHTSKKGSKADGHLMTVDGDKLPINNTRYARLCREYGALKVDEYIHRAYRYSLKKRGDTKQYKDYTAAAEEYMNRDGVEKRKPNRKLILDDETGKAYYEDETSTMVQEATR